MCEKSGLASVVSTNVSVLTDLQSEEKVEMVKMAAGQGVRGRTDPAFVPKPDFVKP